MPQHVWVTRSFFPFWLLAYVGFLLCCALEPSRCLQQLRDALQNGQGEKWEFCWRTGQLSDKRLLQVAMPVAMQWGCSCRGRQWGIAPLLGWVIKPLWNPPLQLTAPHLTALLQLGFRVVLFCFVFPLFFFFPQRKLTSAGGEEYSFYSRMFSF